MMLLKLQQILGQENNEKSLIEVCPEFCQNQISNWPCVYTTDLLYQIIPFASSGGSEGEPLRVWGQHGSRQSEATALT